MSKKRKLSRNEKCCGDPIVLEQYPTKEDLFHLVGDAKLEEFKKYSARVDFLNDRTEEGDTYLHRIAARCQGLQDTVNFEPIIEYLLSQEPLLTRQKNQSGQTPISLACTKATCLTFIRLMITFDPESANIVDNLDMTPLQLFITNVQLYQHKESFYFTTNENRRRFRYDEIFAIESVKLVELFLEKRCCLNKIDCSGRNTLFSALLKGDLAKYIEFSNKICIMLLKNGAVLRSTRRSHIFNFAYQFSMDFLKCIVKYQPHYLEEVDSSGKTLLHHILAIKERNEAAKYLLYSGATIKQGDQIVHVASKSKYNCEIIQILLNKYGTTDINKIDKYGSTLLIYYAKNIRIVTKLLKLGADPNIINEQGESALHTAIDSGDIEVYKKLLSVMKNPLESATLNKELSLYKFITLDIQNNDYKNWFNILEFTLKIPQFQIRVLSFNLSMFYMKLITDLFRFFITTNNSNVVIKSLEIIKNANLSVISLIYKSSRLEKPETYVCTDPIGEIIKYRNTNVIGTYKQLYEFIKIMFQIGFSVSNTPLTSVTALSTLFIVDSGFTDIQLRNFVKLFIEKGVNVESMALSKNTEYFICNFNIKSCDIFRNNYIPDALLLAFINNYRDCVKLMLPFWWGPPLALITIYPNQIYYLSNEVPPPIDYHTRLEIIPFLSYWLPYLFTCARIPHDTKLYQDVDTVMDMWKDHIRESKERGYISEDVFSSIYKEYTDLKNTVPSLQQLSKFKVRQMLAKTAAECDSSLPELIQQVLPYELPDM